MAYVPIASRVALEKALQAISTARVATVPATSQRGDIYESLWELHCLGQVVLCPLPTTLDGVRECIALLTRSPSLPQGASELFRPETERLRRPFVERKQEN